MCLPLPQTPVPGTLVSARPPTWLVLPAQAPGSVQEPQDRPLSREPGLVQVAGRPCPTSPAGSAHFPPPGSDLWEFLRFSCRSSHFLKTISSGPAPRPPPSPSQFGGGPHAEEAQGRPCWPQFKSRSGRPHFPLCFLGCHAASGPQQAVTSASPLCRQEQMASPLG